MNILLFFSLLGASSAHNHFDFSNAKQWMSVENFISFVETAIKSGNEESIRGLFYPYFKFKGCFAEYTKDDAVKIMSRLPSQGSFKIQVRARSPMEGDSLNVTIDVFGVKKSSMKAQFYIDELRRFTSGYELNCQTNEPVDAVGSPELRTYLSLVERTVQSQNERAISDLFTSNFEFKGCTEMYQKDTVVKMLSSLPSPASFEIKLLGQFAMELNYFNVTLAILGVVKNPIRAQFYVNQQRAISSGRAFLCQNTEPVDTRTMTDSELIAYKFIQNAKSVIESTDQQEIERLFENSFEFTSCTRAYSKSNFVQLLTHMGRQTKNFTFKLKSAQVNGRDLTFLVEIIGLAKTDLLNEFNLNMETRKLSRGRVPSCGIRRFIGNL